MKTLAIYDVDDTLIMIDTLTGVKDASGQVVERIDTAEFHKRVDAGELHADDCCFLDYECADTFYKEGRINNATFRFLHRHQQDDEVDVKLLTARSSPSCLDTYLRKFHEEGVDIAADQVIFAANNATGDARTKTRLMKLPYYRELVTNEYDRVIGYEDNISNLVALHWVCIDAGIPFDGYVIMTSGALRPLMPADVAKHTEK